MYSITKQFAFEAAHHLNGLREGHQCARQHGHSYRVEIVLATERLNETGHTGFVRDYGDLDKFGQFLKDTYDHKDLNEIAPYNQGLQTSAENIARVLFQWCYCEWPETVAVRVSETAKTWAEYRQ